MLFDFTDRELDRLTPDQRLLFNIQEILLDIRDSLPCQASQISQGVKQIEKPIESKREEVKGVKSKICKYCGNEHDKPIQYARCANAHKHQKKED
jgi:hypothetical protein